MQMSRHLRKNTGNRILAVAESNKKEKASQRMDGKGQVGSKAHTMPDIFCLTEASKTQ